MKNWLKLITAIAVPQAVGILSGLATVQGTREWYATLERPWFTPPSWIFGPVWTLLYLMMGIAAYLIWRKGLAAPGVALGLSLFLIQLILNGAWSLLFFGMQSPGLALVDIFFLWIAIAATLVAFYLRDRPAGLLLVPYLLWTSFATLLNFSFWRLNG